MFQIEQKIQRLEGQIQNNQNFDMNIMAEQFAKIIDQKASHMLPNVMGQLQKIELLKGRLELMDKKYNMQRQDSQK